MYFVGWASLTTDAVMNDNECLLWAGPRWHRLLWAWFSFADKLKSNACRYIRKSVMAFVGLAPLVAPCGMINILSFGGWASLTTGAGMNHKESLLWIGPCWRRLLWASPH